MRYSWAYILIINLSNTAHDHKEKCHDETCNVSLSLLKSAAHEFTEKAEESEKHNLIEIISRMPI